MKLKYQIALLLQKSSLIRKIVYKRINTFVLIKQNGDKVYNPKIKNLKLNLYGKNNYVEIHEPINIKTELYLSLVKNNKVIIKENNTYDKCRMFLGSNNQISIDSNTTIENADLITKNSTNKSISIGKDCMLSYGLKLRTSDGHTVYDNTTRQILNEPENISIANHVWLAANATILKGSNIPSNCIVGTNSIVNKSFESENCIIAGVPAKVVKENINWDRKNTDEF